MIVVDASVIAPALTGIDLGTQVWDRIGDEVVVAPHILDLEVASVLRKSVRAGVLAAPTVRQALTDLAVFDIERYPHTPLLPRVWELHHNFTPYDACYVALAEHLDAVLFTADARLARAPGLRCDVDVM